MNERTRKVAVVGGGITGLSAAYYLQKQAEAQNILLDITLIEATHRLGGKIQTHRQDGFVIERGPDSFLSQTDSINTLSQELGIEDQLIQSEAGENYVIVEDRLHPVPIGSVMGVPTNFKSFFASDLFSWSGKIRAFADLLLPKSMMKEDQSLGHFVRRRFGTEVVDNLIEPLFSGVFAGDINRMSLKSTFPAFYEQRSLIMGLKKNKLKHAEAFTLNEKGIFQTYRNGLETLVEALETQLSCTILKGVKVEKIDKEQGRAMLELNNDSTIIADDVILALPHSKNQALFEPHGLLKELKEMPSTSLATVSMVFAKEAVQSPSQKGTSFVVARNSDYTVTSCISLHNRWPSQVPEGKLLFKATVGRVGDEAIVDLSDKEIERTVLADLKKTLDISGNPDFTIVSRWKEAMPQYLIGHAKRVQTARQQVAEEFPMVQMIGSSFDGFGLPQCVEQGKRAANLLFERSYPNDERGGNHNEENDLGSPAVSATDSVRQ